MKRWVTGILVISILACGYYLTTYFFADRSVESIQPASAPLSLNYPVPIKTAELGESENQTPALVTRALVKDSMEPTSLDLPKAVLENVQNESRVARRKLEAVTNALKENPHITPAVVIQSGRKLGDIAELELKHPELKPEIQKYYLECTEDSETITVTRVQCLDHYIQSRHLTPAETQIILNDLPVAVRKLYARFSN